MLAPAIGVTQITYDITTGIGTVGLVSPHMVYSAGSKVKLAGAGQTVYNGVFVVQENVGLSTFTVNLGVSTVSAPTLSGTVFGFPGGYTSNDGAISVMMRRLEVECQVSLLESQRHFLLVSHQHHLQSVFQMQVQVD